MSEPTETQKLIRLKRYETPGEEYFAEFQENFKERQRAEMLQQSSVSLLGERVSQWFGEMGPARWAVPATAAAAVAVGSFFVYTHTGVGTKETPIAKHVPFSEDNPQLENIPVIQLKLPNQSGKDFHQVPPPVIESRGQVLPAGLKGPYREF